MKKIIKKLDNYYMSAWDWATSTKGASYLFSILIWVAVIIDPPKTIKDWLLVIVTVYYQGVALSALGSQTKAESLETRQLLIDTHETQLQEMAEIREIHEGNQQELNEIKEILNVLRKG